MCSNEDDPNSSDVNMSQMTTIGTMGVVGSSNVNKIPDTTSRNPNRRSNKPIMEKRRRARINNCLNELKSILLEAMRKDPARHSKLEKADILELTVSHLRDLHRNSNDGNSRSKYRAGFVHCVSEVEQFLALLTKSSGGSGIDSNTTCRLLSHLADCLLTVGSESTASAMSPNSSSDSDGGVVFAINGNTESILTTAEINNNNNSTAHQSLNHHKSQCTPTSTTTTTTRNISADTPIISLVPSRLPSGEIAFIVPGFNSFQQRIQLASSAGNSSNLIMDGAIKPSYHQSSYSPEPETTPLELIVSSSTVDYRSASLSSPSSSSSSPLSPAYSTNSNTSSSNYAYHQPLNGYHQQQYHTYSHIPPAHYQHQQQQGYYSWNRDSGEGQQPLSLVKIKREREQEVAADLSCWRPW